MRKVNADPSGEKKASGRFAGRELLREALVEASEDGPKGLRSSWGAYVPLEANPADMTAVEREINEAFGVPMSVRHLRKSRRGRRDELDALFEEK